MEKLNFYVVNLLVIFFQPLGIYVCVVKALIVSVLVGFFFFLTGNFYFCSLGLDYICNKNFFFPFCKGSHFKIKQNAQQLNKEPKYIQEE